MFVCTKWLCELESLKRKKQGCGVGTLLCSQNLNDFHYRKSLETSIAPNLPLMERIGIKYKRPTTFNDGDCYLIDINLTRNCGKSRR